MLLNHDFAGLIQEKEILKDAPSFQEIQVHQNSLIVGCWWCIVVFPMDTIAMSMRKTQYWWWWEWALLLLYSYSSNLRIKGHNFWTIGRLRNFTLFGKKTNIIQIFYTPLKRILLVNFIFCFVKFWTVKLQWKMELATMMGRLVCLGD